MSTFQRLGKIATVKELVTLFGPAVTCNPCAPKFGNRYLENGDVISALPDSLRLPLHTNLKIARDKGGHWKGFVDRLD